MRLEDYWGVGPKTAALLREELGEPAAIEAIESVDGRTLAAAGLSRGRATRILRRAAGGEGLDLLATRDARAVYRDLVGLMEEYAVTDHAADRVRVLTPLADETRVVERLDRTERAVESWERLDESTREAVLAAFEEHDSTGGEADAVETALALLETGVGDEGGVFDPLSDLDAGRLAEAATALRALPDADGRVGEGADDRLDGLRASLGAVEDLRADAGGVAEAVRESARDASEFRDAFRSHVTRETGVEGELVRETMPSEARAADTFVTEALRGLAAGLREQVDEREAEVRNRLAGAVEDGREDVDRAVEVVDDLAFELSLARFAVAFGLRRPELVDRGGVLAVRGARNLELVDRGESVQPVAYGLGDHTLDIDAPREDRVAVLTGANSGGKTTLLETLAGVALLAHMGLPVPAEEAQVSLVDRLVFHRRHASFNAGVLESTLRSVVPPVTESGRTLLLVDEFEAITEPGSAANLLHGLLTLAVEREALGVFVTHLAEDLEPLPDTARTDGIFAEGLTPDLELEVDYQPRFGTLGRSTPEFIVSRLVAESTDASERAGFEVLARAVGQEAVQRTLADARWSESE
ncbi:DNA mismatch repair protein [Salinirubellus salinus]|uniref:DNA mismatch repair protein n=1 Tax=Salinirubellus salinus TaxID=1364945 RepID=A0A9E7R651_9EURY|nr:DNA mismatch repair protein [Salinirubellus salinus]UWM56534.1 DNA mismatch repair protein [Salinirubellus salinus]